MLLLESINRWVAVTDASRPPVWTFAPIVGDFESVGSWEVVEGMAITSDRPPGDLVGFVAIGDPTEVERWIDEHCDAVCDLVALCAPGDVVEIRIHPRRRRRRRRR